MMQAAQSCASDDMAIRHGAQAPTWGFFAEPEVSSVVMVVANVVGEKSLQGKLIESDDMIKEVGPKTLNPSRRDAVLPRAPERSSNRLDSHWSHLDRNLQPILGVSIKDEKPGCPLEWERFPQL